MATPTNAEATSFYPLKEEEDIAEIFNGLMSNAREHLLARRAMSVYLRELIERRLNSQR